MNTVSPSFSRRVPRTGMFALMASAVGFLAGCATEPDSHVVSAPPPPPPTAAPAPTPIPVTITTTPANGGASTQSTIMIQQAPPAAQSEMVTAQPSPNDVWIAGYWTYRDSRYVWIAGRWEMPPHSGAIWVPPHWNPEAGGYRFYEGYWNE